MVLVRTSVLAMAVAGLFDLAGTAAIVPAYDHEIQISASTHKCPPAQAPRADMIPDFNAEHTSKRQNQGVVHRCYKPSPINDPTPSAEDCQGAITKLQAAQDDIVVKLVEGCFQIWNNNCTASVCPQKDGTSIISPSVAAQFMIDSVMPECISNGLRGWYLDRSYGIGVYLT
ncbi:hypothetical protein F5B19DRAFT_492585 [Rostrohypoxylon terebratum]|nr:hypothetical protein F5B19DRAFT_492585 [Rostrohypoxylon terebratum]